MKRFALALMLAPSLAPLALPAVAADLPSRYQPAPYYDPAPIFTWTGLYVGLNGQFGIGSFNHGGGGMFGNPMGGMGGGTIGYNYQSGKLVVGGEVDIDGGSLSDSRTFGPGATATGRINALGTARMRVGYVMGQSLLYVTGGYAGTSLNGRVSDFSASPNLMYSDSHYLNGYAVGAGIEYAITTKISIKGEYIFTGFDTSSSPFFAGTRDAVRSGANINLIRAGLNYHF